MGGVCGVEQSELTTEEKSRQMEIEKMLREDKKRFDLEIKILLLGTGESGKSTIAKQLKLLYLQGFSSYEKAQFKEVIHSNIFLNMHILCKAATSLLGLKIEPENEVSLVFSCSATGLTRVRQGQQLLVSHTYSKHKLSICSWRTPSNTYGKIKEYKKLMLVVVSFSSATPLNSIVY